MVKYSKVNPNDVSILAFEKIIEKEWPGEILEDFNTNHLKDFSRKDDLEIHLVTRKSEVIGGAIVTNKVIVNDFKNADKNHRKVELQQDGFRNFSYFIMRSDFRGSGYGTNLLDIIKSEHAKLWLCSLAKNISYYENRDFVVDRPETDDCDRIIMRFEE